MATIILWLTVFLSSYTLCLAGKRIVTLHLQKFKQPDDVDTQNYLTLTNSTGSCTRECVKGDHRICYYKFHVENYAILSAACKNCLEKEEDCYLPQCVTADGFEKGILTVNRRLPGPSIQVCYGDRIIVDLENAMLSKTMSIHWHGLIQRNRNYMDGVPFITQCPISDETSFRYDFRADTAGTMYWHAHSALHKLNGLQGSLIVRVPKEYEPHYKLYDYDLPAHNIFIMDWYHTEAETRMPGLIHREVSQLTTYYVINGRGKYNHGNESESRTPWHVFHVKKGKRYRFRIIGAVSTQCPALVKIEGHQFLVIATDGSPIKPVLVDSLIIFSGERYDFILHANAEVGTYWIQVRGMQKCFKNDVCQIALLNYEGSQDKIPRTSRPSLKQFNPGHTVLNPINASCSETAVCIHELTSLRRVSNRIISEKPAFNFGFNFGFHVATKDDLFYSGTYNRYLQISPNVSTIPYINRIQQIVPPSPLQTQYDDIPRDMFCPIGKDDLPYCPLEKGICSCIPITRIPLGAMVQFVLIDGGDVGIGSHAFHLHGNTFNVISVGYVPKNLKNARDIAHLIDNKTISIPPSPVFKDTLAVPARGYAVIRFIADNPGFWLFHCHFLYHHVTGMGTVLQIGHRTEFPSIPRRFPKCGDYLPPVRMMLVTKERQEYDDNDNYRTGVGMTADEKEDEEEELPKTAAKK